MLVELISHAAVWDVRTFSQKAGSARRAKGKDSNWRTGVDLEDARLHLQDVFKRLSE
jgi:hypothetical protein